MKPPVSALGNIGLIPMAITGPGTFSIISPCIQCASTEDNAKGTVMIKAALVFAASLSLGSAAQAASNFSFTGALDDPSSVLFFDFNVGAASMVTLRSWSYAGGVNAAGATIARGGFDPILAVFALPTGDRIGQNDDGAGVAVDAVSGRAFDTLITGFLNPGDYRVSVMVFPNFAPTNVFTGTFPGATTFVDASGVDLQPRSNQWAFDILNVNSAVLVPAVPEPQSWALLIAGFGLTGAAMRRRRMAATA
jgi:hypothetical protein